MNQSHENEDQEVKVDVRSRIAALNGQNESKTKPPRPTLKSSPKNTSLAKQDLTASLEKDDPSNNLNVKDLVSLYAKNSKEGSSSTSIEEGSKDEKNLSSVNFLKDDHPILPARPSAIQLEKTPPTPPNRPQFSKDFIESGPPPQVPSRPSLQQPKSEEANVENSRGYLPYVPRRPVPSRKAAPSQISDESVHNGSPSTSGPPKLPQRNDFAASKRDDSSSESPKAIPALPPRKQTQNSIDSNISKATSNSPISPIPPIIPSRSTAIKSSSNSTYNNQPVAPPPRHIDSIPRASPKEGLRLTSVQRKAIPSRMPRKRRRDERDQMRFCSDPDQEAEERYSALYSREISKQIQSGGSSIVLEQDRIVRLWRRSKLDSWFLQQVFNQAKNSKIGNESGSVTGLDQTAFLRGMNAIDLELTRRRTQIV